MGQSRLTASTCMIVTKYDNAELKQFLMWRQVHWYVVYCIPEWLSNGDSGF